MYYLKAFFSALDYKKTSWYATHKNSGYDEF